MSERKSYFDRKPEDVPLARPRRLIGEWVVPANNLFLLTTNVATVLAVSGVADLVTPAIRLFPWLFGLGLGLVAWIAVLRSGRFPQAPARRLLLHPMTGPFVVLLTLVSLTSLVYAARNPDPRGALASHVASLDSLQASLLHLQSSVDEAVVDLKALRADSQAKTLAIESFPGSLAVVGLSGADVVADGVAIRANIYLTARNLSVRDTSLKLRTLAADGTPAVRDLSGELAAAGDGDAQQLSIKVPAGVRQLTFCLAGPYPSPSDPHVVVTSYAMETAHGEARLTPAGRAAIAASRESPCVG